VQEGGGVGVPEMRLAFAFSKRLPESNARQLRASPRPRAPDSSGFGRMSAAAGNHTISPAQMGFWLSNAACPRQESNLRTRFRKPLLYPLSYGGGIAVCRGDVVEPGPKVLSTVARPCCDRSGPVSIERSRYLTLAAFCSVRLSRQGG
jgi:hypothetical protein